MSNTFIVDDQDASIEYTGHWNVSGQQPDFSHTASSGSAGATMSFSFSGNFITAVGDFFAGGTCDASFSIDGASPTNVTSPATNDNQYQQTLWTSPTLNDGNHTLFYTVSSCNSSGSFVWLDYLLYNSSNASVTGATSFFDNTDSSISYSGTWNSTSGEDDFRGTVTGLGQGGSFQFDFDGTSVQVYGVVDNSTVGEVTEASFSVDGSSPVSYTAVTSSNLLHNSQFFASRLLNPGQHKLTVLNTGDFPIWVDYLVVRGQAAVGDNTMPANNSNSLNRHQISVIVGSVVGGVCGIILLVALAVLLYRKRQTIPSLSKRPKKDARHHDVDPPPGPIDFEPHRPKFTAYDSGSSLLKAANSSVEMHSLARGRQPYSSDSSPYGTPRSSNRPLEASEEGYCDEKIYVGQSVQLTREGTYNTLPNPYSIRNSQSYRSESSHTHSVDPNVTLYSSSNMHAHTDGTQRLTKTPSESSAAIGTSDGYGYTFTPVHRMRRIANMDASDEDNLSVAELKRRQSQLFLLSVDGMAALPLVHTDSGLRMHSHPEAQAELPPVYSAE